jgi:TonB family protein
VVIVCATPAVAEEKPEASVTPPEVVSHVDAIYPTAALADRKHGDVVLTVTVDGDGHVSKIDVAETGGGELDEAAITAMRQWTFRPAMRDGKPVASRIRVPFHFAPPAPPPEIVEKPASEVPELPKQPAIPTQPPAPGAETTAPPNQQPAPALPETGEEVNVVGRRAPPSRGVSDFNLRVGELARVPRANASEMLKLAPGILLTNEGGEGHAEQVFLRGFDAREGQDVEFTVDGVPINESGNLHGNGYADTHFIIPELVESLRVLEGPFDPRQGNYAVGGSANYELGLEKRGLTAKYLRGSFGTERFLLLFRPNGESSRTFAGAEIYKTDGFGQNRDAQRGTAMAQYEGRIGDKGTFHVTGTAYGTSFHTAGVIREDDYERGRIGFYDSYDFTNYAHEQIRQGGDSSRYSIAGDIETKTGDTSLSQQLFLIARSMRLRENFTGFLDDTQIPVQSPHDQRGDLIDLNVDEATLGLRGYARWQTSIFGRRQEVEFGYFARGDQVGGSQQRIEAATGTPYKTETNIQSKLGDLGLYADLDLHPTAWLVLRGGVRSDLFTFNVNDLCAEHPDEINHPSITNPPGDVSCLDQRDRGIHREPNQRTSTASTAVLPRATIIAGPFEQFSVSASYGKGARSIDPIYITTQDSGTPFASINSYEAGLSYAGDLPGPWSDVALVARSLVFQTHVDQDLIFNQSEGRNVLSPGTTRTGWVGAVRLTGRFFDEAANLTFVRSTYDDTHLLVPYVPDAVLRSDTAIFSDLPWEIDGEKPKGALSAGITYVGRRALPLGQRSQTIFTLDTSATLAYRNAELGLVVTNLFDRRYRLGEYNFESDFHSDRNAQPTLVPMRHFAAGAPRGIFGTFAVTFGGK